MKTEIREWTKWTHKKHGITMEVTKVWRGKVNLWDKPMRFRWTGTEAEFRREWRPANAAGEPRRNRFYAFRQQSLRACRLHQREARFFSSHLPGYFHG